MVYKVRINLNESKAAICRRIQVSADITLSKLHRIIHEATGWTDSHLHQFVVGDDKYKIQYPYSDLATDDSSKNERTARLRQMIVGNGFRIQCDYDFGDNWTHTFVFERVLAPEDDAKCPRCVGGARACPAEDVGGIYGYGEFLEALRDPTHPQYEEITEWIGGQFEPEAFDLTLTNRILKQLFP